MLTFKVFQKGLYLLDGEIGDPGQARVGFLFQDAGRTDPTFVLSAQSYTDPGQQGYFAFFPPSATRGWDSFAAAVRDLFQATSGAQIGWFDDAAGTVTAPTLVLVGGQGTNAPKVAQPFSLQLNNLTLQVNTNPFLPSGNPPVAFDDASNQFYRLVKRRRAQKLDRIICRNGAVGFRFPVLLHQKISRRPV